MAAMLVLMACALPSASTRTQVQAATPIVLPNGRTITPAGSLISAGDFPAAAVGHGSTLFVSDAGVQPNFVVAFSKTTLTATYVTPNPSLPPSFSYAPWAQSGSIVLSPDGSKVYIGGGATHKVESFSATSPPVQGASYDMGDFVGQVAVSGDGQDIFATLPLAPGTHANPYGKGSHVVRYHVPDGTLTTATVGRQPWPVTFGHPAGGDVVAVGNRDDGTVSIVRASDMTVLKTVAVGRQPSFITFSADGSHMFVICSLDDTFVDVRTSDWHVLQQLNVSAGGPGAAPDGAAISAGGDTAYVPLGFENALAVLTHGPGGWQVTGRIPTAQYPTAVVLDGGNLYVTNGKGIGQAQGIPPGLPVPDGQPVNPGSTGFGLSGIVERIPVPNASALAAYSQLVSHNNLVASPQPATAALKQVKHVFYVIRENKTYDENFGDEPGGTPDGLLYGRQITPNAHTLAEQHALLTNFYADEEVSDTGHQAVMGGEANDWVQRFTEQSYGLDGAPRPGAELGNGSDILWAPANYLMDQALAAGIDFKDYGEFVRQDQSQDGPAVTPALESHVVRTFPGFGFNPDVPDTQRVAFWKHQFDADVAAGTLPALEVIYLPEDHTSQGNPSAPLPQQQVASSDLATGQLIEALSHSSAWSSSAMFLTEDDPQSGIDHVDTHRTIGLVVGPMVKAGVVNTRYDQAGMLRTVQQILGLPPLTQVDATARTMDELFTCGFDPAPYSASSPVVPPVAAATVAAVHAQYAARAAGTDPATVSPEVQRDIQWLAVRGSPFPATAADPEAASEPHAAITPPGAGGCGLPLSQFGNPASRVATGSGGLPNTFAMPLAVVGAVVALLLGLGLFGQAVVARRRAISR